MYDMNDELSEFYENHVRLGRKRRRVLAEHRDTNLRRLKTGLKALDYPSTFEHRDQGSYAMYTINQHPDGDYDIDEAIIFAKDDLPSSSWRSRKRIEEAMQEGGGNFSQEPEAKTNCVRVYYAEGHHIDLAIYRQYEDEDGQEVYEHAGTEWTPRHPMKITNWFNDTVHQLSPPRGQGATVAKGQMRRVVRWLKMFAKSRESWDLPRGLIISVLVAECYKSDPYGDDVSLYNTIVSIRDWLNANEAKEVPNPVDPDQLLTSRNIDVSRLERFEQKLDSAISHLDVLFDAECDREDALKAWHWFFQHSFWSTEDENARKMHKQGEILRNALDEGSVFVAGSTGRVSTKHPDERSVQAPPTRYYGDQ
jgi:cyclic GMP-AMP synthase DncV-like protein